MTYFEKERKQSQEKVLYMNCISKCKSAELKLCLLVHSTLGYFTASSKMKRDLYKIPEHMEALIKD